MKLLLIDPNIDGRAGEPPLNIALLKAYIDERSNHKCKILDLTFHRMFQSQMVFISKYIKQIGSYLGLFE